MPFTEEIYNEAFDDELEKIANEKNTKAAVVSGAIGAGVGAKSGSAIAKKYYKPVTEGLIGRLSKGKKVNLMSSAINAGSAVGGATALGRAVGLNRLPHQASATALGAIWGTEMAREHNKLVSRRAKVLRKSGKVGALALGGAAAITGYKYMKKKKN
jgi:hypothetical protein